MKNLTLFLTAVLALVFSFPGQAQESSHSLDQALSQYSQAADTLAAYPVEVRQAILEASLYPDTLFAMGQQQQQSSAKFQKLVSPYPRKTQEKVYDLVRYPDLMESLVRGGKKSSSQIKKLAGDYPKGVQKAAKDLGRNEYPLLRNIQSLYARSDNNFDRSLQSLPLSSQTAYRTLLRYPEALETLSENRNLTLALGQAYRSNPGGTKATLDKLSVTVAQQNQDAAEDYRNTLKNDPKARAELKKSAKVFASEYGYEDQDYDYPPPTQNSGTTVVNININPYPYWFGYPYWYSYSYWRPYPIWYHTGFYFGLGGALIAWSTPSFWYTNWFYAYPSNFYRYPYLASCYGNYYYRWRQMPVYSGFHRGVRHWHHRNRHRIHDDLWRHDRRRGERWRDFGHREDGRRGGQDSRGHAHNHYKGKDPHRYRHYDKNKPPHRVGKSPKEQDNKDRWNQGRHRENRDVTKRKDKPENKGRWKPGVKRKPSDRGNKGGFRRDVTKKPKKKNPTSRRKVYYKKKPKTDRRVSHKGENQSEKARRPSKEENRNKKAPPAYRKAPKQDKVSQSDSSKRRSSNYSEKSSSSNRKKSSWGQSRSSSKRSGSSFSSSRSASRSAGGTSRRR